jgi:hypothetical protein
MMGASAVGNKVYLFGGIGVNDSCLNTILCFDTEARSITVLSITLPNKAFSVGVSAVANKIYLFGGRSPALLNTILCFDTTVFVENGLLVIIQRSSGNVFSLINTDVARVEIGVGAIYKGNANNEGEQITAAIYKDGAWTNI